MCGHYKCIARVTRKIKTNWNTVYVTPFVSVWYDSQFNIPSLEWLILFENLTVSLVISPFLFQISNFRRVIFILMFGRGEEGCMCGWVFLKSVYFCQRITPLHKSLPSKFFPITYHSFTINKVLLSHPDRNKEIRTYWW